MAHPKESPEPQERRDRDEPVSIPLDPEEALRGLLKTEPDSEPSKDQPQHDDRAKAPSSRRARG
jgi:hypothetical protein